jgi:hypothetical protein
VGCVEAIRLNPFVFLLVPVRATTRVKSITFISHSALFSGHRVIVLCCVRAHEEFFMCLPCEQRFHLLPPCRKKSFYFPRKNKNVNTFSGSRYWHLHDCSIDGLRNFMFFFVTNGVCNRDSIDLKKCDGEEKEKNK